MDILPRLRAVALLCLGGMIASATAAETKPPEIGDSATVTTELDGSVPKRFQPDIRLAQIQGRLLNQEDRAAWVASDLAVERKVFPNHPKANGWVAAQLDFSGNLWRVSFTEKPADRQLSFYDAQVDLSRPEPKVAGQANDPASPLSDVDHFLAEYRDLLLRSDKWLRCTERYNYSLGVGLEDGKKVFIVKLLPSRTNDKIFPLGGFHEFRFAAGEDRKEFSQTRACVNVDTTEQEPEAFVISHITSATPTQFHVFMSLSYGKPIYVATTQNGLNWLVEAGIIKLLENTGPASAK